MKLLASDLDGTFTISPVEDCRRAVAKWQQVGNIFVIVSGRSLAWLPPEFDKMEIKCDYYLANNGAVIADSKGNILRSSPCPGEWIKEIMDFIFRRNGRLCRIITDRDQTVFPPDKVPNESAISREEAEKLPFFYQISTVLPTREEAAQVTAELAAAFPGKINPLQNGICIDIVAADMTKAQGIRNLIEMLNLREADVITVGDNFNDLSMIEAFYSYAIESGEKVLREYANCTTPDVITLIDREL